MKEALEPLKQQYDYIIIDTPPALGILTVNALTACDTVIIPAQADVFSLHGIEQLNETIKPVRTYCNPSLTISGILLTRFNARSILANEVKEHAERLAQRMNTKVFTTTIREAVAIKEAQITRQPIFDYAPAAKVTADYKRFIDEFLATLI